MFMSVNITVLALSSVVGVSHTDRDIENSNTLIAEGREMQNKIVIGRCILMVYIC